MIDYMTVPIVVADTSVLINFLKIDRMDLATPAGSSRPITLKASSPAITPSNGPDPSRSPRRRNGGVFTLDVLRDSFAKIAVDPVVAAGEIRPLVRLCQRLDGKADAQRRSISSAWRWAARASRSFGLRGLISASAKRI